MSEKQTSLYLRRAAKQRFNRTEKNLLASIESNDTLQTVESTFDELRSAWDTVQQKHDDYMALQEEAESDDEDPWISEISNRYHESKRRVGKYIEKVKENEKTESEARIRHEEEERNKVAAAKEAEKKAKEEKDTVRIKKAACLENKAVRDQEGNKLKHLIQHMKELMRSTDSTENGYKSEAVKFAVQNLTNTIHSCDEKDKNYIKSLDDASEDTVDQKWISSMWDLYNQCYAEAHIFIAKYGLTPKNKEIETNGSASNIRIEKIKVDTFNGEIRKYARFKDEFKMHIKPECRNGQEAFVLKSYLKAEIKEEVDGYGEDIEEIWNFLDKRYGSRKKLIDAIMSDIKKARVNTNKPTESMLALINTVERAHRDLERMGMTNEIENATIIGFIEQQLPGNIREEWVKIAAKKADTNLFPHLLEFLRDIKERMNYDASLVRSSEKTSGATHSADATTPDRTTEKEPERRRRCWIHKENGEHPIWRCRVFQGKSPEDKLELVRRMNACEACLEIGHSADACTRNFRCNISNCNGQHHRLLHDLHLSGLINTMMADDHRKGDTLLQLQSIEGGKEGGEKQLLNVFWDNGSTLSFITFKRAEELKLKGRKVQMEVTRFGGSVENIDSNKYELVLVDQWKNNVIVEVYGIDRISADIKAVDVDRFRHLFKCFPKTLKRPISGQIDCLIGFDYAAYHPIRKEAINHLLLLENIFGMVLGGSHPELREGTERLVQHALVNKVAARIDDFYSIESLGVECNPKCGSCKCGKCQIGGKEMTLQDEREMMLIENNMKYEEEHRSWVAGYPWIKDPAKLPNNYNAVFGKLKSVEKRLQKNPSDAKAYEKEINSMVDRGAAKLLTSKMEEEYNGPEFYVSHHAVMKPDSKSTPCRIVFNSSANYEGHVLNDYYAKGPDMLNNLLSVLLKFRERGFAYAGDISKMFHSVRIPEKDQMTHKFLWRGLDVTRKPQTYVMTAVNMGDKPSAAMAMVALQKTAQRKEREYPYAAKVIKENSYMDDIIDSVDSEREARETMVAIEEVLAEGGFRIKEWMMTQSSDCKEADAECFSQPIEGLMADREPILGMHWSPNFDKLSFRIKDSLNNNTAITTKRQLLSRVNGVFDPLGLISPFLVRAKIMLKRLWLNYPNLGWDDPVPDDVQSEWRNYFEEMKSLRSISFNRCIRPDDALDGNPTLILFSDGSSEAYGTAAYIRWKLKNGSHQSSLVAAKNKVAPAKTIDIVRLELAGAVLSKRLRVFLENNMRYQFNKVYHAVDSEIVKAMISKQSYGFNTFVANRIGEIQEKTDPVEWYWMPGDLNISDWLTRGKSPQDLMQGGLWQNGPDFLKLDENEWPLCNTSNVSVFPEMKAAFINTVIVTETLASRININRFSNLLRLLNVTARILKLYETFRSETAPQNMSELTVEDKERAETFWIKDAQKQLYQEVATGKLKKLCPRYEDGIIIVGGRAERWMEATWNHQAFVLLPEKHRFSFLVAEFEHIRSGHLGVASTIAKIRSKYWIINIKKLVKGIRRNCVPCKRKFEDLSGQIMADLPIERLKPSPPFDATGVDYFGPFPLKGEVQKRIRGRGYGVIFVCMVSRAVYVDLCIDYSTDGFMQVLRRFSSLRGWPRKFHSDNGSQLTAASKELKNAISGLDWNTLRAYSINHKAEWKFSPADAPWFNGHTEALVKTVKRNLSSAIGDHILSYSELQTVMFEVAQLVNQRPIGTHPEHPEDGQYLCPNDLLLGRATSNAPQGPFLNRCSLKHRTDFLQRVVQNFWDRWSKDVFPHLIIRQKWHLAKRNLMIGDVVLIQDSNLIRGQWKMGVVKKTHQGSDGRVRHVDVEYKINVEPGRLQKQVIHRPVHRLIVLVAADETENEKEEA